LDRRWPPAALHSGVFPPHNRAFGEGGTMTVPEDADKVAEVRRLENDPQVAPAKGNSAFDPIAVGKEIAAHLAEADKAVAAHREYSMKAGALLLDVAQNHPEHLDAICKRISLGLSRRKELLMIAGGRKTVEQSRADNKRRQDRFRAKHKPKSSPAVDAPEPLHEAVTATAAPAATPQQSQPAPTPTPTPTPTNKVNPKGRSSSEALAEFKFAARQYLPDMIADDQSKALDYVVGLIKHLTQEVAV
jgi:hypothetical protein